MKRSVMDRIIDTIEAIAAMFVGLVAADIFLSVLLRRFFSLQIPDSYDFGQIGRGTRLNSSHSLPSRMPSSA